MTHKRVTDHAVLRYLERVKGVDVESIREHIKAICLPALKVGALSVSAEGARFEFTNGVVTTVIPLHQTPNNTKQARLANQSMNGKGPATRRSSSSIP